MTNRGFVKVIRELRDWPVYRNAPPTRRAVMLELLLTAEWQETETWDPDEGDTRTLEPGQVLVSQRQLAADCNTGRQAIRNALEALEDQGFISRGRACGQTLVTLEHWSAFQGGGTQQGTQQEPSRSGRGGTQQGTQGVRAVSSSEADSYSNTDSGGNPAGNPADEPAESPRGTQGGTQQRARDNSCEEVEEKRSTTPPSGTSSPPSREATAADSHADEGVGGFPEKLQRWVKQQNGTLPAAVLRGFRQDVAEARERDETATSEALKELAGDPPDYPKHIRKYFSRILDRHMERRQEERQRERELQENTRRKKARSQRAEKLKEEGPSEAGEECLSHARDLLGISDGEEPGEERPAEPDEAGDEDLEPAGMTERDVAEAPW